MARSDCQPGFVAPEGIAWFCVRSHPKHEHIAAGHLRACGLEVYLPRIRFQRSTRRGTVWFTEALFPTYLFARFELAAWLRRLNHLRGVQGVVHFGNQWPPVPEDIIQNLRALVRDDESRAVHPDLQVGEAVRIATGAFRGCEAIITRVMPAQQRVAVLLEFLGNQSELELASALVEREPGKCLWAFDASE